MIPSTDGVEVASYDLGGEGPTLFLFHATGFCGGVWLPVIDGLRERFRCVTMDFRGHGRTHLPEGVTMGWEGIAEDLMAVVDHYEPDGGALAVGHSLGGGILILASDTSPGLFRRAWAFEPILFEKGPIHAGDEAPDIAKAARRRRRIFSSRSEVIERYGSRIPLNLLRSDALWAYAEYGFTDLDDGTVTLCCDPDNEASTFEHHASGALEASGRLGFPTAVVASGDGGFPAAQTRHAAEIHPNLTLHERNDLTHFGPLEDPPGVVRDLLEWFSAGI